MHIRENVSLIALHTATTSLPPQPLDISLALVPTRTTTDTPMMVLGKVVSRGLGFGEEGEGEGKKGLMGLREVGSAERAIVSTAGAGGGGGASDWVQAQGRKVAELRKAKRDLVLVRLSFPPSSPLG